MSDLEKYIKKRKRRDALFAEGFEVGYSNFKVGVLLRQAREKAGMTQDEVARRLRTRSRQFRESRITPKTCACLRSRSTPKPWARI